MHSGFSLCGCHNQHSPFHHFHMPWIQNALKLKCVFDATRVRRSCEWLQIDWYYFVMCIANRLATVRTSSTSSSRPANFTSCKERSTKINFSLNDICTAGYQCRDFASWEIRQWSIVCECVFVNEACSSCSSAARCDVGALDCQRIFLYFQLTPVFESLNARATEKKNIPFL